MCSPVHGANDAIDSLETLRRPLSKADALNIAFARNGTVLQARKDVEAATGVSIQLRAIVYPKLVNQTQYSVVQDSLIEANKNRQSTVSEADIPGLGALRLEGSPPAKANNQDWNSDIRVVQSVYEGGRIGAALRSSRLIRDQALLSFQATAADVLLSRCTLCLSFRTAAGSCSSSRRPTEGVLMS
jgi:outer membrane protein TolC